MQYSMIALAVSGLVSSASAHMMMAKPVPYGWKATLDNSPLMADGSDFPCKGAQQYAAAPGKGQSTNTAAVGGTATLAFLGTAVHGGGSCQVSLTTDLKPTKNSKWMVIHSIEGGCPAKNQAGNLPDGGNDEDTYPFKIPQGIAPGEYTLAWTWFNRRGNREMYMNCAPFTVTGGKKRGIEARKEDERMEKRQANFPAMHTANICNKQCETGDDEYAIYSFPDPGASVANYPAGPDTKPAAMKACKCFDTGSGSGSSTPSKPNPANQAPADTPTTPAAPANTPANTPAAPAAPAAPVAPVAPVAPAAPAAPAGGCTPGGLTCSADGTQFGICTTAGTAVMQAVAPGTACRGGAITRA